MKRVLYKGRDEKRYNCHPAYILRKDRCYEVSCEIRFRGHTNYILKNIEASIDSTLAPGYSSEWFDVIPVYVAISKRVPVIGECLGDIRILNERNEWEEACENMCNIEIHVFDDTVFEVYTKSRTYIVKVIS